MLSLNKNLFKRCIRDAPYLLEGNQILKEYIIIIHMKSQRYITCVHSETYKETNSLTPHYYN